MLFRDAITTLDEQVFNDPIFKGEGERYWGANSAGQENRYDMMKSFYMAFDYVNNSNQRTQEMPEGDKAVHLSSTKKLIDNEMFTTSMIAGEVDEELKKYEQGHDQRAIIAKWLKNVNSDLQQNTLPYTMNEELASKWLQLLGLVESQ